MLISKLPYRFMFVLAVLLFSGASWLGLPRPAAAAELLDRTPRIAVISAFEPELALLLKKVHAPHRYSANGVQFTTGTLQGKPVVLFLSGISMTNAAMTTQLALDRFRISHIVFSGIAGGVNPDLHIGDVTVAQRWGQYLELVMARETGPGVFSPPPGKDSLKLPHFGMMFVRPVRVRSAAHPQLESKFWFDVDPHMLAVARGLGKVHLGACDHAGKCLNRPPELVVGGSGVSGSAFVDNAAFRRYVYDTFHANVLDMESAACAAVAYSNGVPFIAFRSLSDLAGGGEGVNEMHTFLSIAADNSAKVLLAFLAAWH
ncbi:5'-methylthioadenosine/S-adenosylhomocysteine nucleosidase [Candidimonas humi]|uniref:5'-methylthioadenosine/S-adenosylhomocysteine nucleosidase n=1 Tax=Candidimonas humi TaxID=683355 RepID=A0ABV8NSB1_9BURK|nr:5'-methylthioadenosine/S-adenosylhomocysteine nucleosidase [Candidimonas humi]MBV6303426.1 5'-methylthioadenosine/S-adenosylhomocysteine nucleosidase [Candidimonas humi]